MSYITQFFAAAASSSPLPSFLVVLTALVFVHELGHYLVARRNGVEVEVFSIGFGPEIFGWWDRAGTRWKFSAIPLGGYVKMFGDSDAASSPSAGLATMTLEEQRGLVPPQAARPARRDRRRRTGRQLPLRHPPLRRPLHHRRPAVHAAGRRRSAAGQRRRARRHPARRLHRQHRRPGDRAVRAGPADRPAQPGRADDDGRPPRRRRGPAHADAAAVEEKDIVRQHAPASAGSACAAAAPNT